MTKFVQHLTDYLHACAELSRESLLVLKIVLYIVSAALKTPPRSTVEDAVYDTQEGQ